MRCKKNRKTMMKIQITSSKNKYYWKKNVEFINATENYITEIKDTTAAVIIGDRALENRNNYTYCYDLAEGWKALTGLPFVFALWVSNIPFTAQFITQFDNANNEGLNYIDDIVTELNYPFYDLKKYYTQNICYTMDDEKRKSVELFLQYLKEI